MPDYLQWVICLSPLAMIAVALILRFAVDMQPQSPWSNHRRILLLVISYSLFGVAFIGLWIAAVLVELTVKIPLVMTALAMPQLMIMEFNLANKRRQIQQVELLWLLATTTRSGAPLPEALEAYAQGTWGRAHRQLCDLAARLREGTPLSDIVVPQDLFSRAIAAQLQSGLQAGRLDEALRDAALRQTRELNQNDASFRSQVSFVYPAFVLVGLVAIVMFMVYFTIPKMKKIFSDFGTPLPSITQALLSIVGTANGVTVLLIPVVLLIVTGAIIHLELYCGRSNWRRFVGLWFVRPYAVDILRSLSQIISARLPLDMAFVPYVSSMEPHVLQNNVAALRYSLQDGEDCWAMLRSRGFLTADEVSLIESAQQAGNLPWVLNALADGIERRRQYRLRAALEFLGPTTIVACGIIVAFVVVGLFLPLVKLLDSQVGITY